jgi:hypothetical protein
MQNIAEHYRPTKAVWQNAGLTLRSISFLFFYSAAVIRPTEFF